MCVSSSSVARTLRAAPAALPAATRPPELRPTVGVQTSTCLPHRPRAPRRLPPPAGVGLHCRPTQARSATCPSRTAGWGRPATATNRVNSRAGCDKPCHAWAVASRKSAGKSGGNDTRVGRDIPDNQPGQVGVASRPGEYCIHQRLVRRTTQEASDLIRGGGPVQSAQGYFVDSW